MKVEELLSVVNEAGFYDVDQEASELGELLQRAEVHLDLSDSEAVKGS